MPSYRFEVDPNSRNIEKGATISNPQHSNPEEDELWVKAKSAEGAERADALVHLSYIAHSRNDYEQSLALCESAKEIYESLGAETSNEVLAHVYSGISYSLNEMQRNEEAVNAGKHAIELLEEIDSVEVLRAYRDEGRFAFEAKNYQDSLAWYLKALNFVSPDEKEFHKAWDQFYVARALIKLDQAEEAVQFLKSAREIFKADKSLLQVTFCDEELALAYLQLGQLEFAKAHAELSVDFAATAEDEVRQYWSGIRFAQVCEAGGEFQTALNHYKTAKSWEVGNSKYTYWPHVFQIELQMANCLEGLGQLDAAIEVRRRINSLSESLGTDPEMP